MPACGLLGAGLLVTAELTTLYVVRASTSPLPIKSVASASNHAYALIPVAALAVALLYGVWRAGSRPATLAIGLLGVIVLLIALLGDLPSAHATGLVGTSATHYAAAGSSPSAGFYLETLGGVMLVIAGVSGLLLLGPSGAAARSPAPSGAAGSPAPSGAAVRSRGRSAG